MSGPTLCDVDHDVTTSIRHQALAARALAALGCLAAAYLVVSGPLGWPTLGPQRWTVAWFAMVGTLAVAAFVAAEEVAALARHRTADATGARHATWPATTSAPAGADAIVTTPSGDRFAVVYIASTGRVAEGARGRLRDSTGLRRGVNVRRLQRAAARSDAVPAVIAEGGGRCRSVDVVTAPDGLGRVTDRLDGETLRSPGGLRDTATPQQPTAAHTGCSHPDTRV